MTYIPEESRVIYQSKDGKEEKVFDALEWLAAMCSHVPNKGEQMVKYYGHYSNVSRGKRKKQNQDELIPSILEPDGSSKEYRRNWSRLIQKIYEVNPLICPKCQGLMKILSFIESPEVIKKILKHLGLWEVKARPPPRANASLPDVHIDYSLRGVGPMGRRRILRSHPVKIIYTAIRIIPLRLRSKTRLSLLRKMAMRFIGDVCPI